MARVWALGVRLAPLIILVSVHVLPAAWAATAAAQQEAAPGEAPEVAPGTDSAQVGEVAGESSEEGPEAVGQAEEQPEPPSASADTAAVAPAAGTTEPAPPVETVEAPLSPPPAGSTEERPPADPHAADAAVGEEPPVPWRGSVLELRNAVGIIGLDPSAELTHNPYYMMALSLRPRWWFGDILNVRARLDLEQELTNADDTTYADETVVQDLWLSVGASRLYRIPVVDIDVSTDLRVTLPTSKVSRARTLALALGPGLGLEREIPLGSAGTLTVGYSARFSILLHQHTTAERETPLIPGCGLASGGCDSQLNTGLRNSQLRLGQGLDVTYDPLDWLGFTVSYLHTVDWLYPIEGNDPRVSYEVESNTDVRYRSAFGLEATFTPTPMLVVGFGYETVSPQQAPDSTYYNPLFNRYSTLFLDLRLQVEALVDEILDTRRGQN